MLLLSERSPSASSASFAGSASYWRQVALAAGRVCHIWMEVQPELVALQVAFVAFAGIVAPAVVEVWQVLAGSSVLHWQLR